MKFTKNQRQILADLFVNLAVAWVSFGTISQVFFKMEDLLMVIIYLYSIGLTIFALVIFLTN